MTWALYDYMCSEIIGIQPLLFGSQKALVRKDKGLCQQNSKDVTQDLSATAFAHDLWGS